MRISINEQKDSTGIQWCTVVWEQNGEEVEQHYTSIETLIEFLQQTYQSMTPDPSPGLPPVLDPTESRLQKLEQKQESIHRLEERILMYERGRGAELANIKMDMAAFTTTMQGWQVQMEQMVKRVEKKPDRSAPESVPDHSVETLREVYDKPGQTFFSVLDVIERRLFACETLVQIVNRELEQRVARPDDRKALATQEQQIEKLYGAILKNEEQLNLLEKKVNHLVEISDEEAANETDDD